MKKILNHLVQLQELEFVLLEKKELAEDPDQLTDLEESIQALLDDLDDNVAALYQRLKRQGPAVVVPVSEGKCSACSMRLPTSQMETVLKATSVTQCQNCRRILYHFGVEARSPQGGTFDTRPSAGVARFSSPELMLPSMEATTQRDAVTELANLMADKRFVEGPEVLVELALRRETIASTALSHGIAIPHVRGVEGGGLTLALGLQKEGFPFDPSTGELTHMVFFSIIPTAASGFYLKLLSGLIEAFGDAKARKKMMSCDSPEDMWEALTSLTSKTIQ